MDGLFRRLERLSLWCKKHPAVFASTVLGLIVSFFLTLIAIGMIWGVLTAMGCFFFLGLAFVLILGGIAVWTALYEFAKDEF